MAVASAPGKIIVLGEHAVVFGQPALALAIDLRISCRVRPSKSSLLNGTPLSQRTHPYIFSSVQRAWSGGPVDIETSTEFPTGSGMGSSAAVTVACLAALSSAAGKGMEEKDIAIQAFEVESQVQGRASPIDTSVSTHGRGILVASKPGEGFLWHIQKDTREWFVHLSLIHI